MTDYCSFGDGRDCRTMPGESGLCPRHEFMVANMGAKEAERAEIGLRCSCCGERFLGEGVLADCDDCGRADVCGDCLEDMKCCEEALEDAREEFTEVEDRVGDLEAAIGRKQRADS